MVSYEYGLVAPVLVLLAELVWRARRDRPLRPSVLTHLPFWAVLAVIVAARLAVTAALEPAPWWGGSWRATVILQLRIFVEAWRLSFLPFSPIPPRYLPEIVPTWITPAIAIAAHAVLVVVVVGALIRGRRRLGLAAAIIWWYVAQAPTSNIVIPNYGFPFGIRFLIVALALPVALVADWLAGRSKSVRLAWICLGLWLAAGVVVDRHQTRVWANTRSLFTEVVRLHPDDAAGHLNLGDVLMRNGDFERAAREMEAALALRPRNPEVHYALGQLAIVRGRSLDARRHLTDALRLAPRHVPARIELARTLAADGLAPAAATWLSGLGPFEHYPAPMRARFDASLAEVAHARGLCDEAGRRARSAVLLAPHRSTILRDAGTVLVRCGFGAEGRELLRRAADRAREDFLDMVGESALHE
jgi:Flp pilus assembly protein TadD